VAGMGLFELIERHGSRTRATAAAEGR